MSEVYRKVGRGGAGNFYSSSDVAKHDAQTATLPLHKSETMQSVAATPSSENTYAHMGRGGAGNYYSPKELPAKGDFTTAQDGTAPLQTQVNVERGYVGRGGAGNYTDRRSSGEERRSLEEKRKQEAVRRSVESDVESGLEKPEAAVARS